ncbi:MAG TPA: Coenzyme F420 hydrogenase/dehydrogenase, beta subunit C-terminal domain [Candidatus Limnocylindrales bacterium]|nr:Coenzyme F420 hydrogenase/dehydrogenase, beta subunit C-terminal domain [Candidatus Limnocylindrales bacterium]
MSAKKTDFQTSLLTEVVETGKCVSCGTCVVTCPFGCLELAKGKPSLVKECKVCGICAQACPRYNWAMAKAEDFVFGRIRNPEEAFGVYRRIAIAQAKPSDIQKARQDGGAATAMLVAALQNGLIDGAVVSGKSQEKPFLPVPILATTAEKIIESAGTKYTCSSTLLALPEVIKQKKTQVAFVGTPCQIQAVRKMQMSGVKKFSAPIKYLVGLMCSESFDYEGLMETYIKGKLGINLNDITKMNIKGKMLVTTTAGTTAIPLAEVKPYVRMSCSVCEDFSSELADVSVGGLGLDGWTFTIIRTEKGEELFANAEKTGFLESKPVEEGSFSKGLLLKLTKKKQDSAAAKNQLKA